MTRRPHSFGIVASSLLVSAWCAGCSTITGAEEVRVAAFIAAGGVSAARVIVAPDTVRAGVPFTVSVSSFGSSSCTRPDGATVNVAGMIASIAMWDRERIEGACTDDLRQLPRDVLVQFNDVGTATIRVQGRANSRATVNRDSLVVVEKQVVVR